MEYQNGYLFKRGVTIFGLLLEQSFTLNTQNIAPVHKTSLGGTKIKKNEVRS